MAAEAKNTRDDAICAAIGSGVPTNAVARALGMSWPGIQKIAKG